MGTLREYVVRTIFFTIVSTPGQPNILVDSFGHARIADFGLTTVTKNQDSLRGATSQRGHTAHWTAPELMDEGTYSKEADIFAFAMVTIEVRCERYTVFRVWANRCFVSIQVFTGARPFGNYSSTMAILAIAEGERPPRPKHPTLTEILWMMIQRCWDQDPQSRPEVPEVLEVLQVLLAQSVKQLISHGLATPECISLVATIFSDDDQAEVVGHLPGDEVQAFVDMIYKVRPAQFHVQKTQLKPPHSVNQALDSPEPEIRTRCLRSLYSICGRQALLPRSLAIPIRYNSNEYPLYSGGFADVWKGRYGGQEVAVKVMRMCSQSELGSVRRVCY